MTQASSTDTRCNILAVDDTPENLELLNRILSRKGFKVALATNGRKALDLAREHRPELILLDICMPQMDGYAVCQALKGDPVTQDIPIIFVSALDEVTDKIKAFKMGGVDFITKPFHSAEVIVRVDNHLTLRRLNEQLKIQNELLRQEISHRIAIEAALQAANQELERLAHLDGLTQVANRRGFDNCLVQEWRRLAREQSPLTLILCDVDFFKRYNDTYGHQAGDDCLRSIASAISTVLKRPGDLVARYGGEEFAIILPNTPETGAMHVAAEIRAIVEAMEIVHVASPIGDYVTLSLGIATVIPQAEFEAMFLLSAADRALYKAKLSGRNCVRSEDVVYQTGAAIAPVPESGI